MRISDWSSDVCSSDLRREKIQLAKKRDAVLNRAPSSTFFWEAQPLQGPTLVLVTYICISMSPPPIGDLPFEVTRTSLFLVSRVPSRASSTFCAPCVQVHATALLPLPSSFLLQVQPLQISAEGSVGQECASRCRFR